MREKDPNFARIVDATPLEPALPEVTSVEAAEAILGQIAAGLFPGGIPDFARLVWSDEPKPAASGAEGPADFIDGGASAETRLRAVEARFRTLVEQIPAVTFMAVLGEGKNEIYVSPHIEQMLGFTQDEWLENPSLWYWQLHPDDRLIWNDEFARGCRTGGPFRAECRFLARDGRTVWVHGEARLARDAEGRPLFLQGVAFDITESKRAQLVLVDEAVRRTKIEEELAIAKRVQTSILPRNFAVEGLDVASVMVPADEVGGDYYDVLPFPGGGWIAIGDVSGHGLNSGLVMLMVQSALAAISLVKADATPREILGHVNKVLFDNIRTRLRQDDHVTLCLLRYASDGRVSFAGAHEDIIIRRAATGAMETLATPGTWLGARRNIDRALVDTELVLAPDDLVVLYTDGVTEAMSAAGEQFGMERHCAVVERLHEDPPARIRDGILDAVRGFMAQQADDISIIVMRYVFPALRST